MNENDLLILIKGLGHIGAPDEMFMMAYGIPACITGCNVCVVGFGRQRIKLRIRIFYNKNMCKL